jgi:hypothetical protein
MISEPPRPTVGDPCRGSEELSVAAHATDVGCVAGIALVMWAEWQRRAGL